MRNAVIVGSLVALALLTVAFWPRQAHMTVADREWSRSISIERLATYQESGRSLPDNARMISKKRRCVPRHNGKVISQSCHWKYTYDIERFKHFRYVHRSGTWSAPEWPSFELATSTAKYGVGQERDGSREEHYKLVLKGEEDRVFESDQAKWSSFEKGEVVGVVFVGWGIWDVRHLEGAQ